MQKIYICDVGKAIGVINRESSNVLTQINLVFLWDIGKQHSNR